MYHVEQKAIERTQSSLMVAQSIQELRYWMRTWKAKQHAIKTRYGAVEVQLKGRRVDLHANAAGELQAKRIHLVAKAGTCPRLNWMPCQQVIHCASFMMLVKAMGLGSLDKQNGHDNLVPKTEYADLRNLISLESSRN